MPDPMTIGGAAVAAYLSKDGVSKLLGPTAEYLGGEMKNLVEKSQNNIASVFKKAEKKCGAKIESPGTVNPRVMKHVYDEARFSEDELLAEYFGGVLASARTEDGVDDRGVYYSQIVKSMSSYQIKCHYFFYYLMWHHAKSLTLDLNSNVDRAKLTLVVPIKCYEDTFANDPDQNKMPFIAHALSGLAKSDLIGDHFALQNPDELNKQKIEVDQYAFVIHPTITGLELFVWVHGQGEIGLPAFIDTNLIEKPDLEVKTIDITKLKGS
ncbi:hypothetical protein M0C34_07600 [Agarivorans sp. TSD2052]|uniref:hypothetical protein n=1 Tax=Agarivorans sp. TSD2052 TaxID=2937286 RepID=UPI00200E795E|nr:hypothetical protein [Agarivorans sp. TSD2052]UPW20116.1 hypothetical protein M0C34_07600 [Agarivorans sp. TSD2052]